jgi:hypothetical protein
MDVRGGWAAAEGSTPKQHRFPPIETATRRFVFDANQTKVRTTNKSPRRVPGHGFRDVFFFQRDVAAGAALAARERVIDRSSRSIFCFAFGENRSKVKVVDYHR